MSRIERTEERTFTVRVDGYRCDGCGREWFPGPDEVEFGPPSGSLGQAQVLRARTQGCPVGFVELGWMAGSWGDRRHLCRDCVSAVPAAQVLPSEETP